MKTTCRVLVLATLAVVLTAFCSWAQSTSMLNAQDSDPAKMKWMVGSPPPPDKVIYFADMSFFRFPKTRWSFSNFRQLVPTSNVWRGEGMPSHLRRSLRSDIDSVTFQPLGRTDSMTWAQSLEVNYTDAVLVMHKGQIVYERYLGIMKPHIQHAAMSVTKAFFGTLGAMLVAEGKLEANTFVSHYIPELKNSAYRDATVRQVLDMTVGLKYSEDYANPNAEIWQHSRAGSILPRPAGYTGPQTFYEFLQTVKKEGEHGEAFAYKTVNTDVIGWLIRRASGQSVGDYLSSKIWQRLGAEQDGYMLIDSVGNEFAGAGFNSTLRDLARFAEMIRLDGFYNGQQIIPKAAIDDIRAGGRKSDFAKAGFTTLPGWSYRNMWWISHNEHGAIAARGIHGQAIYIDPKAEMVIVRFGSHPIATSVKSDPTTLPAFHALAKHLMKSKND